MVNLFKEGYFDYPILMKTILDFIVEGLKKVISLFLRTKNVLILCQVDTNPKSLLVTTAFLPW